MSAPPTISARARLAAALAGANPDNAEELLEFEQAVARSRAMPATSPEEGEG